MWNLRWAMQHVAMHGVFAVTVAGGRPPFLMSECSCRACVPSRLLGVGRLQIAGCANVHCRMLLPLSFKFGFELVAPICTWAAARQSVVDSCVCAMPCHGCWQIAHCRLRARCIVGCCCILLQAWQVAFICTGAVARQIVVRFMCASHALSWVTDRLHIAGCAQVQRKVVLHHHFCKQVGFAICADLVLVAAPFFGAVARTLLWGCSKEAALGL